MPSNHFVYFEFPHRMNKDGTIDSICPRCFATVGCSTWEADLDRLEAAHICEPARLNSSNQHRRMPVISERLSIPEDVPARAINPVRSSWPHRGTTSRRTA